MDEWDRLLIEQQLETADEMMDSELREMLWEELDKLEGNNE